MTTPPEDAYESARPRRIDTQVRRRGPDRAGLPPVWAEPIEEHLERIRQQGRWRTIRSLDSGTPRTALTDSGRRVVSFAGNDYLGLSQHPDVVAAAHSALDAYGTGSGAARLIVGGRPVHDRLEEALADWKEREAALLFTTGYQANVGVITALAAAAADTIVHSDELNHASMIDGTRLGRGDVRVYPHMDLVALDAALGSGIGRPQVVVTDEVFSMDGDVTPVDELAALCRSHGALLVLDVAHSALAPPPPQDAVVVGTLSKMLGSLGGFVAGPRPVVDLCRNVARSFIFTTASTPADTAAALAAVGVVRSEQGGQLVAALRANVDLLAPEHPSPIVPIMLGPEVRAVRASADLLEEGFLVPAIRPPTVPPGSSRLRIAMSAAHDPADVARLADTLRRLGLRP